MTRPASAGDELLALYAELDSELAELQATCAACGRCCDFSTHGEVLYASGLERQVLALAGPPPDGPAPHVCPYLSAGKCAARPFRPLGCRTYFCEKQAGVQGQRLYERCRARIAALSRRAGIEWDYCPVLD